LSASPCRAGISKSTGKRASPLPALPRQESTGDRNMVRVGNARPC
jgi:hypothetical protein